MEGLLAILFYILLLSGVVIGVSFVISVVVTSVGIWMVDRAARKNAGQVVPLLPGKDCGQCGCADCREYAQMIADERKEQGKCPFLSAEDADMIEHLFPTAELKERPKLMDVIKDVLHINK